MLSLNMQALENAINEAKTPLRDGLLAIDIWDASTGLGLVGWNSVPAAIALFSQVTKDLQDTLQGSGFPGLRRYYLLEVENDRMVLIQRFGDDLLAGLLLDENKTNLGILLSVVVPKLDAAVKVARS